MEIKKRIVGLMAIAGIFVLILDGRTALNGATTGINLCTKALIPSLFPFFVLSILLTRSLSGQSLTFLRPISLACKMPNGTESIFAIGILGGYPVGAQNIASLYQHRQLSRSDAMRMVSFCNNAGPAFIFGVLSSAFDQKGACFLLWAVQIISAIFVGMLLPGDKSCNQVTSVSANISITDALSQSVKVMSLVCGWVIIVRTLLTFMERWFLWLFPVPAQVILSGILELSNGCIRLTEVHCEGLRFIIAAGMLSLGGICVTLQTASVAKDLPLTLYFPGKLLQCSISIMLSYLLQIIFPVQAQFQETGVLIISGAITIATICILKYREKSSSIPAVIGV